MELDTTKIRQAGFRKTVSHDNCIVLDLSSGAFPRYIEVRPPGDDGSRQTAVWDGSLDLAVNDKVIAIEYAANPIWRIQAKGGDDSGAGSVRVSKIWESDFGAVALQADAAGDLTLNGTRVLNVPSLVVGGDIIHSGDSDNKIGFTDDAQTYTVGGVALLTLTEAAQDVVVINEGEVDVDFRIKSDIDSNAFFLRGSDGNIGIGSSGPDAKLDILNASGSQLRLTHTDGILFAEFTLDASSDLTIKPAAAGQIILQPTTDSVDFFQVLDADGGDPVLNVDSINERVAVGSAAPDRKFLVEQSSTGSTVATIPLISVRNTNTVGNSLAGYEMVADNGAVTGQFFADGNDLFGFGTNSIYFRVTTAHPLIFGTSNTPRGSFTTLGNFGVGTLSADAKIESFSTTNTQLRLTFQDSVKFADFVVDTNHDLTIKPSSTGQIILQPTTDSIDFFQVLDANGGTPILNVDSTNERVGIGTAAPASLLHLENASSPTIRIQDTTTANSFFDFIDVSGSQARLDKESASGNALIDINPKPADNLGNALFRFFRRTDTVGTVAFQVFRGDDTATIDGQVAAGNTDTFFSIPTAASVGIGTKTPAAKLAVDQPSTTAAIPVALFDQADISEEMFEFATTIGVGNAIEAVGSKLFTITHFIKNTLPGALTRYSPVGTIGASGPKFTKSQTVTTQGLGANPDIFAFGFYESNAADANLTQASTTQTFGTANISYAAHAFAVTGGAGTVDAGVVGLRVNGTSINDQGTRTTSDTETIIADITAAALNDYQETAKKWLGQVTFELFTVSGSPTTFSLDFNYGRAKYDDWFNADFTITDIEAVGFSGANDSNFDIKLMHHQPSGWAYSAAAFTPITAANTIASLVADHSTDDQLLSSQHFSWKRDNLSQAIDGTGSEGYLIFISSSANNAIEYLNLHIGATF